MKRMQSGIAELYLFHRSLGPPTEEVNTIAIEFGGRPLRLRDETDTELDTVKFYRERGIEVFGIARVGNEEDDAYFLLMANKNRRMIVPKGYQWCIICKCSKAYGVHEWLLVAFPLVFLMRNPGAIISIDPVPRNTPCPFITSNPKKLYRLIEEHYSAYGAELVELGFTHESHPLLPKLVIPSQIDQLPDGELFGDVVNPQDWVVM